MLFWKRVCCWAALFSAAAPLGSNSKFLRALENDTDDLSVLVTSGRTFLGRSTVDTTADQLVLLADYEGVQILRPIAWSRIREIRVHGVIVSIDMMRRELVRRARSQAAELARSSEILPEPAVVVEPGHFGPRVTTAKLTGLREGERLPDRAALSLDFFVRKSRWGMGEQGLELWLLPRDEWGELCAETGQLIVEFHGLRTTDFAASPRAAGLREEQLGSWTFMLREADFRSSGAFARLPFAPHLFRDDTLGSHGRMVVRWIVPGRGILESYRDGVRFRDFEPIRYYGLQRWR